MDNWYQVTIPLAHQGAGRDFEISSYLRAQDIIEVLNRYQTTNGTKKSKIPDIVQLSSKKELSLEKEILKKGLCLEDAKINGYCPLSDYNPWRLYNKKAKKCRLINLLKKIHL